MAQLPDLQSDADVDALMARVRAKLVVAAPPPLRWSATSERSGNALRDFPRRSGGVRLRDDSCARGDRCGAETFDGRGEDIARRRARYQAAAHASKDAAKSR
jgi:hypothetical protein